MSTDTMVDALRERLKTPGPGTPDPRLMPALRAVTRPTPAFDLRALHRLLALARQTGLERIPLTGGCGYAWKSTPRSIATPYLVTAECGPDGDYWLISVGRRDFIAQSWEELCAVLRMLGFLHILPRQFAEVTS